MLPGLLFLIQLCVAAASPGVTVREVQHKGDDYLLVSVDLHTPGLALELYGQRPGHGNAPDFDALDAYLRGEGRVLQVATNAGMFKPNVQPVGLHIEHDDLRAPIELGDGVGNFYLKPNGVFSVDGAGAHVVATEAWTAHTGVVLATQSGPLLLQDGVVHPAFQPASHNLRLRSGVGVSKQHPWVVHLAISKGRVRFHDFATLFRDLAGCSDALFLDGEISALRAPGHPDASGRYSGILAVTVPVDPK